MQAVILAAGQGLRLRPFTQNHPKPLINIGGQPLLTHTLNSLPENITEIIIVVGYLGEQIIDQIGDQWNSLPIKYVTQANLVGTGDALLQAKPLLKNKFLVINGDDIYQKSDLEILIQNGYAILAWPSQKPYQYGLQISPDNHLIGFDPNSSLTNCGVYLLDCGFFEYDLVSVPVHNGVEYSLPHTMVKMAEQEKIKVIQASSWLPVGTPEQLEQANQFYKTK
ncbi:MAG: sugar phosphate nucleotidyltransferase [Candidatus Doudnabacteria bacterium]